MENNIETPPQQKKVFKLLLKGLVYCVLSIGLVCVILTSLLFIYQDEVKQTIINEINKHLKAEVKINPKNIDLTIISTFPNCSIEFNNVLMLEALPIKNRDTLLFTEKLNLHFNISDLWNKKYNIKKISIQNAIAKPIVTKSGKTNYAIWDSSTSSEQTANDSISFNLNLVTLTNCHLIYKDKQHVFKTDLLIKELKFKGSFSDEQYELNSEGKITLNQIISKKNTVLQNKKCIINIDLNVNKNNYVLNKASVSINNMLFNLTGNFTYKDSLQAAAINYEASRLDIKTILSLLPENQQEKANEYTSEGTFYANGDLIYKGKNNYNLISKFGIKDGLIRHKQSTTTVKNINIDGHLVYSNTTTKLELANINLQLNNDELNGKLYVSDFSNPFVKFAIDATSDLETLQSFWPIDTLSKLKGRIAINSDGEGLLSDFKSHTFSTKVKFNLASTITNLEAQFKGDAQSFLIENCLVAAKDREVEVKDLKMKRGSSDILLNGTLPGIYNYLSDNTQPLIINGNLFSNYIRLEDFMLNYKASEDKTAPLIPKNIQFKLNTAILKFSYAKFEAQSITGEIEIKNQKAIISDVKLNTMQGEAEIDAYADNSENKLDVVLQSKLKNMNVNSMFYQFENFGQATLQDKNIKGFITANIDFSGSWNNALESDLNSIRSTIDLKIDRGELLNFTPLMSLSKFVDIQDLQKIKFSSLQSNIEIKDKTIFLPSTSIKNSALNITCWGSHSFNNDINYHIELLISELLSKKQKSKQEDFGPVENDPDNKRSAFILMTGTVDNPVIKYDRKGLKENIKKDIKEEKQNLKQLLKEEFGLFKKDTLSTTKKEKSDQKFELDKQNNKSPKKTLEPDKKKETDDDF